MRSLPIYRDPESPLEGAPALDADPTCQRCSHKGGTPTTTCLPHEGESGGILVVDSFPTRQDFATRRPLASSTAATVRAILAESGQPVAYTTALRCAPKGDSSTAKLATGLAECRPYLRGALDALRPTKIIALGGPAIYALTGSVVQPQTMRGGFSWLHHDGRWIPVHYATGLAPSARNKFLRAWMEEDVRQALAPTPVAPPSEDARAIVIESEAEARAAVIACNAARWTAVDAEWAGRPYDRDFKLLCIGLTAAPTRGDLNDPRSSSAFVFPAAVLADPAIKRILCDWLADPKAKKVGSYFKSDTVAFHAGLGVWTRGVAFDTRLLRRLMDPEASGRLADMAHLVGRGGHKDELKEAMSKAVSAFKRGTKRGPDLFGKVALPPNALPSHGQKLLAGEEVERYGFAFVDPDLLHRYNAADTSVTSLVGARLEEWLASEPEGMQQVADLVVRPAADAYARIESWGMGIDRAGLEAFRDYLSLQLAEVAERFRPYGFDPANPDAGEFNPNSNPSIARLLFDRLKLKATKQTSSGADSTDADALEELADQHPVVRDLLMWRKLGKLKGTYADGLIGHIRDDGRVHPNVQPDGARTGRTSCVAGWTRVLVRSADGLAVQVPISEVRVGDLIWTHLGRWRRVTRFLPQGVRPTVDVVFSNGAVLTCTTDHRLLCADGRWATVEELAHECVEGLDAEREEPRGSADALSQHGHSNRGADCVRDGNHRVECAGGVALAAGARGVSRAEVDPLLGIEGGGEEPHVAEDGGGASQLDRRVRGRTRLPYLPLEWEAGVRASGRDDGGAGADCATRHAGRASHRQQPEEQRAGQSGAADQRGPCAGSRAPTQGQHDVGVSAVNPRGSLAVYDLTVEDDESYVSAGVCSHNCSEPNLQNQPSPESPDPEQAKLARMLRDCYVPSPNHVLMEFDYSQLELRVAADLSGDPAMLDIFRRGEDYHLRTAKMLSQTLWGITPEEVTGAHRREVKGVNFALLYDDDPYGIAFRIGADVKQAEKVRDAIFGCFPILAKWIKARVAETQRTGYAWTWWAGQPARRRPLTPVADPESPAGKTARRGAWNGPIQGTGNEYLVASAIECVDWILGDGIPAKLLVTIHDSMLFEVREDAVSEVHERVPLIMAAHQTKNGVPLLADAKVGRTWARMKSWKAGTLMPNLDAEEK